MIPTKEPKETLVDINTVTIDRTLNYREDGSYQLPNLIGDIAERGLMQPIRLEKLPDGKLVPVQGFRRSESLLYLANNDDPETGKRYIDPMTGKPFGKVRAIVYEGLTHAQRLALKFDHGQVRNLNKPEMFEAICDAFDAQVSDKEVVVMSRSLLEQYFPPKAGADLSTDTKAAEYWKGAIQPMKLVWAGPVILREQYKRKLRGEEGQNWPTKSELKELTDLFKNAVTNDKTNTINRTNPGVEFTQRFEAIAKEKELAAIEGRKPNPMAMMNRTAVDKIRSVTDSQIGKTAIDFVLQKIPTERYSAFDKLLLEIEKTLTDEQKEVLKVVLQGVAPDAPKATTAPANTAVAAA